MCDPDCLAALSASAGAELAWHLPSVWFPRLLRELDALEPPPEPPHPEGRDRDRHRHITVAAPPGTEVTSERWLEIRVDATHRDAVAVGVGATIADAGGARLDVGRDAGWGVRIGDTALRLPPGARGRTLAAAQLRPDRAERCRVLRPDGAIAWEGPCAEAGVAAPEVLAVALAGRRAFDVGPDGAPVLPPVVELRLPLRTALPNLDPALRWWHPEVVVADGFVTGWRSGRVELAADGWCVVVEVGPASDPAAARPCSETATQAPPDAPFHLPLQPPADGSTAGTWYRWGVTWTVGDDAVMRVDDPGPDAPGPRSWPVTDRWPGGLRFGDDGWLLVTSPGTAVVVEGGTPRELWRRDGPLPRPRPDPTLAGCLATDGVEACERARAEALAGLALGAVRTGLAPPRFARARAWTLGVPAPPERAGGRRLRVTDDTGGAAWTRDGALWVADGTDVAGRDPAVERRGDRVVVHGTGSPAAPVDAPTAGEWCGRGGFRWPGAGGDVATGTGWRVVRGARDGPGALLVLAAEDLGVVFDEGSLELVGRCPP